MGCGHRHGALARPGAQVVSETESEILPQPGAEVDPQCRAGAVNLVVGLRNLIFTVNIRVHGLVLELLAPTLKPAVQTHKEAFLGLSNLSLRDRCRTNGDDKQ